MTAYDAIFACVYFHCLRNVRLMALYFSDVFYLCLFIPLPVLLFVFLYQCTHMIVVMEQVILQCLCNIHYHALHTRMMYKVCRGTHIHTRARTSKIAPHFDITAAGLATTTTPRLHHSSEDSVRPPPTNVPQYAPFTVTYHIQYGTHSVSAHIVLSNTSIYPCSMTFFFIYY